MKHRHSDEPTEPVAKIQQLRNRAEAYRIVADLMTSAESRAAFLGHADDYDRLAQHMEHLIRGTVEAAGR